MAESRFRDIGVAELTKVTGSFAILAKGGRIARKSRVYDQRATIAGRLGVR